MLKEGAFYSATLHIMLLILLIFGLPNFFTPKQKPEPMVVSVEMLPISAITNVKPNKKTARKDLTAKKPKKQITPKPKTPTKTEDTPKPKANPVKIPEKPKPKPKKKKEKKKEEKKPEPKKEKPKKKIKPKISDEEKAILKDKQKKALEDSDKKKKKKDKKTQKKSTKSQKAYNSSMPLSISEKDSILGQFAKCWRVPAGAVGDYDLIVQLNVTVRQDGYVTSVELPNKYKSKYSSNSYFRAAVDSAVRAVKKCNPIEHLPPNKYDTWKDMELTFNPRDMLY